jgi:hypothetical protein
MTMLHQFRAIAALTLCLSQYVTGASLKEETKETWDAYLKTRMAEMQTRLKEGSRFLWLDEQPGRTEHVRTKGPYIQPIGDHIPAPIPSGLIHAWIGAGFVPSATIPDILRVVRDYDSYEHVYKPSITRLEERDGGVYAELEAYALSRDIPAAFRLIVSPIVRRVSRDSLAVSLHQTKVAIDAKRKARTP